MTDDARGFWADLMPETLHEFLVRIRGTPSSSRKAPGMSPSHQQQAMSRLLDFVGDGPYASRGFVADILTVLNHAAGLTAALDAAKAREEALREATRAALAVLDSQVTCVHCTCLLHAPAAPWCQDGCAGDGDREDAAARIDDHDLTADALHVEAREKARAALGDPPARGSR